MAVRDARILILCKTYPSPSTTHGETSCVAGMEPDGKLVRLFPVPFRVIADRYRFAKWQWIDAKIEPAGRDRRPESHRIFVDTITKATPPISTRGNWSERGQLLERLRQFADFDMLEAERIRDGTSLGLLRPARIIDLEITPTATADWTRDERDKLLALQRQGGLFDSTDRSAIPTLRKLPFDCHYRYECRAGQVHRHKIVDWEVGALYWKLRRSHGANWMRPFRQKIHREMAGRDLRFLMGTIHRFPDQWLIVALLYPPKPVRPQPDLFGR